MDEKDESKWIIGIIAEGSKSDYWKLLQGQIMEWKADEIRRFNAYRKIKIRTSEDMQKHNEIVDRLEYLNRLLTINETIIDYHKSFLERFKEKVEEISELVGESFVKNFNRFSASGGENKK